MGSIEVKNEEKLQPPKELDYSKLYTNLSSNRMEDSRKLSKHTAF